MVKPTKILRRSYARILGRIHLRILRKIPQRILGRIHARILTSFIDSVLLCSVFSKIF
jgi:hypothetical protein